jgi:hypothetical protein
MGVLDAERLIRQSCDVWFRCKRAIATMHYGSAITVVPAKKLIPSFLLSQSLLSVNVIVYLGGTRRCINSASVK